MKKTTFALMLLLVCGLTSAQGKEKLKGSKIITIEKKEVEPFDALEVKDDLEVYLIKGDKNAVELEADDNLQSALGISMNGNTIILSMAKEITGQKRFSVRVTYTDSFKSVTTKDEAHVLAYEEIKLDQIDFHSFNDSRLFLNASPKSLSITADDKSHVELNAKSESITLVLSKNTEIKALISSTALKCDLYQKAVAKLEGDVIDMTLRMDNNASFTGKGLTVKNMALTTEGYVNCSVYAETTLILEASGNSEVQIYGEPKIDLKKFSDSATLVKKPLK
jgi:putative autotransporter adhesin-like protein